MSLKGALYQYLTGVSDVTDLVGTDIYRGTVPGDVAQPYAVYHV
ncbi:MAG: tail completion protein gp17, partial [Planctomycetota bacterium]